VTHTSAYAVRGSAQTAAIRNASVRSGLRSPRTGAKLATDGAGGSGYADRSGRPRPPSRRSLRCECTPPDGVTSQD
jgi:hypothetical protein